MTTATKISFGPDPNQPAPAGRGALGAFKIQMIPTCAGIAWLALLSCSAPASAQVPGVPNAGSVLRDIAPPSPPPPLPAPDDSRALPATPTQPAKTPPARGASFVLKAITLSGNDHIPAAELAPLYADKIGHSATLADLDEIGGRITQAYRTRGYVLAQTILPPQDVTSGEVTLTVLEGRIGHVYVNIAADAPLREDLAQARLQHIRPGEPLMRDALERSMLLLSDLPGIRVSSALEAGSEPGTADMTVSVQPGRRWDLALELDNYGTRTTGEYRAGVVGRINSPFLLGDNIDYRLLLSERLHTAYGRVGYDAPLNADGLRAGIGLAHLRYELGKEFAALDAHGEANIVDLSVVYPLLRSRVQTLLLRGSIEYRDLTDKVVALGVESRKSMTDIGLAISYEGRDDWLGGGFTSGTLSLIGSQLDIKSSADRAVDDLPTGRHTAGGSGRLQFSGSRLQAIVPLLSAYFGLVGQWASKNLDSAARLALGGPRAVRAYSSAEGIVDQGVIATAELRYAVLPALSLSAFYDHGAGRFNAKSVPGQGDNSITRSGAGIGVYWSGPEGINLRASLAWRTASRETSGSDRNPRLFVQMTKSF